MRSLAAPAFFIAISLLAGVVGSAFMGTSIETWYPTLVHPSFTPPNWVFGPVWTLLYILMGIAAYLVSRTKKLGVTFVLWLYFAHLIVNAFWSIVFFTLHEILLSVFVILLLLGLIILLAALFYRYSRFAAYLMVPYILWVSYAAALSIGFLVLN